MERNVNVPVDARDVSLVQWLDGVGFHPADTELKQLGHEAARLLVALLATHLHQMLPPGRDKSLVFTHLEDVLMRANRALALGGGPKLGVSLDALREMVDALKATLAKLGSAVPEDARIGDYKAEQRGDTLAAMVSRSPLDPVAPYEYQRDIEGGFERFEAGITAGWRGEPVARLGVVEHDNDAGTSRATAVIDDPSVLEEISSYALAMANQLRALQAR